MKRLILTLFLFSPLAFGQQARVDIPLLTQGPNVPVTGGPLPQTLWVANATVTVCTHPSASYSACLASPVTTTNDATGVTPCPTNAQLTQLGTATPTTCSASAGTAGNVGFWYAGGIVDYWVVSSYGTYGPFSINPPSPAGTFTTLTANVNRIIDVLAPPYNAKCDGTTLDDTAFQAACTAVQVSGGTMEIPPSKCKLSQKVCTITSPNVTIRGSGQQSTTLDLTGVSAIPAVFDVENASNIDIGGMTIKSATGATTGTLVDVKVRYSSHIKLHDLALVNSGYATGANPQAAIYTENDYDIEERNISLSGSGGSYEFVNGYNGFPTIGLHQSNIHDENNLTTISLSNFNCQWCVVDQGTWINQNNQTDIATADGYGILFYTTNTSYSLTSGCTGAVTLTCTVPLSGGVTQLPVAPQFSVKVIGVTGGTGTINGTWDATLLSSTTFSFVSAGSNAAGASFAGATIYYPTAHVSIDDVTIKNTAGTGIYFQGCMYCSAANWNIENADQQQTSGVLPAGCIAVNSGYPVQPVAIGDSIGPGVCNGSTQQGIDFANTQDLSISGPITIQNVLGSAIRDFDGTNGNSNFDIGGNITINGAAKCFGTAGSGSPHNGSVGPLTCSNFTTGGLFPNLGNIDFRGITVNAPTFLPCVDDFQTGNTYTNVWCNAGSWILAGSGTKIVGGGVRNTTGNHAVTFLGAQHIFMTDFTVDNAVQGLFFVNNGATQPTDITIKNPHLISLNTQSAITDQAPGAITIATNTTNQVTVTTGATVAAGMGIGDYGAGGNNDIPFGTTITVITGTCSTGCTLTLSQAATGTHASDPALLQGTMESGVNLWDADIQGNTINTQGMLFYGMQGLDMRNIRMSGFTTVAGIDLRGQTGQITPVLLNGANLTGSSNVALVNLPGGTVGSAGNVKASNINTFGTATNSINDNSAATGNVWTLNGSLAQALAFVSGSKSTLKGQIAISLTPAAVAASACAEQTFSFSLPSGQIIQAGQWVTVTPPGAMSHTSIAYARGVAGNSLVIQFCGDGTGGTPPAGSYVVQLN